MRFRYAAAAAALLCIAASSRNVFADAGDLDPSFGNQGRTVFATNFSFGHDLALQSDGKIVAAASVNGFHVVRYGTNGVIDATFGIGGVSEEALVGKNGSPSAVVIQPDDYIVVAGTAFTGGPTMDFAVVRFDPDGNLDPSFGSGGEVITAFGPAIDRGRGIALQPDGKIIVVGDADIGGNVAFALARYESDGTLDATFGTGGLVTTNPNATADILEAVAVQPDGRIVVAGASQIASGTALLRYEADGDLDPTFGVSGMASPPYTSFNEGYSIALQPDGKILVGGIGDANFSVARFDSDGAVDTGFADGGATNLDGFGFIGYAYDLAVQPNGSIIAAGTITTATTGLDFAVVRLLPNGRVDPNFAGGSAALTDINNGTNGLGGVALQNDGNIVVAGFAFVTPSDNRLALARYQGIGPCEPGPAPDGDGDLVCDAGDSCFNPGGARDFLADPAADLRFSRVIDDLTTGNDALKLSATFDVPVAFQSIDPGSDGARLIVARADGSVAIDATLAPGVFAGGGTAGWAVNGAGTRWIYRDRTASPPGGVVQMKIRDLAKEAPGRVTVQMKSRHATYPLLPSAFPVSVTVVLGDSSASAAGVCGEGAFAQ